MTTRPDKSDDRFGMPERAFKSARDAHPSINRTGMYVPTRDEVATLPPAQLRIILIDWLWESPTELIPSNSQIEQVLAILESRPDAADVASSIAECREYLNDK